MSRDYQRSRFYRWENHHVHAKDRSVMPFEQAQAIVDYVWAKAGRTYPPKVAAISKSAIRSVANANRLRIRIPRSGIKTTVRLHEIAHTLARWTSPRSRPRFVGVFLQLLYVTSRRSSWPSLRARQPQEASAWPYSSIALEMMDE